MIEVSSIIQLLLIMLGIKLILENWQPPLQKSLQALVLLLIGGVGGFILNPSIEGAILGLVGGTVAFWGRDVFAKLDELEDVKKEIKSDLKGGK